MEKEIITLLKDIKNELKENNKTIFYGIKDVINILGWSDVTVKKLFNRPDFPCTDYGKEKKILKSEFENYFKKRRIKDR